MRLATETTPLRELCSGHFRYFSLEHPNTRRIRCKSRTQRKILRHDALILGTMRNYCILHFLAPSYVKIGYILNTWFICVEKRDFEKAITETNHISVTKK